MVNDLYKYLWAKRRKDFKNEGQFRLAFEKALKEGFERRLFLRVLAEPGSLADIDVGSHISWRDDE